MKIIAGGQAAGIILNATINRMLLVLALVSLFGKLNRWLPAPMARLLRVTGSSRDEADDDDGSLARIA